MEECAGRVMLGMMVCADKVYAPVCISAFKFFMSAASMASGSRPSKVMIMTRVIGLGGRGVTVGRKTSAVAGRAVGVSVAVGGAAGVGVDVEAGTVAGAQA